MDVIDPTDDDLTGEEALIVVAALDEDVDDGPGAGTRAAHGRAGCGCLAMAAALVGLAIVAGPAPRSGRTAPHTGTTGSVAWSRPMC